MTIEYSLHDNKLLLGKAHLGSQAAVGRVRLNGIAVILATTGLEKKHCDDGTMV
jgi:hypothetical protein